MSQRDLTSLTTKLSRAILPKISRKPIQVSNSIKAFKNVIFLKYKTESLNSNPGKSFHLIPSALLFSRFVPNRCFQTFFLSVYQNVFPTLLPEVQSFQITLISFTVKWCVTKEATGPFVSEMQFLEVFRQLL